MNRYTAIAGAAGLMLAIGALMPRPEPAPSRPTAAAPAPPPVPTLSAADEQSYDKEITYQRELATINTNTANEAGQMGAPDVGLRYAKEGAASAAMARCLTDERARLVPFYEAKARCKAAEG
jgi:hypothetical protein